MKRERSSLSTDASTFEAIRVLEFFARGARVTFDRPLAMRTVTETVRAIPGDDALTWSGRLVEAGESLNLRVRATDLTVWEVLRLVGQGVPVCVCRELVNETRPTSLAWFALAERKGRRVRIAAIDEGKDEWVRVSRLSKLFGVPNDKTPFRCITGQAALPCEVAATEQDGKPRPVKPLERLVGLLRPEKNDLWAILVFSVMVGVLALASPIAVEALVNTVAFGRYVQPIIVLSFMLLIFLGFAAAIRGMNTLIAEIIQRRLFVRVVEDLAYRLPRVQQQAWDHHFGPELVNRFFDVVTVQKTVSKLALDGTAVVLQTVIGLAVVAFYHPYLLGFDIALLSLIVIVLFGLGRGAIRTAIKESRTKYAVAAWLEELVRHPTAFKLHGGSQFAIERADKLAGDYLDARRQHFRIVWRQILFALAMQALAATTLLGLGGWLVIQGELTLGQLVAAELIVTMIVGSFAKLGQQMEGFYDLMASVDKLGHLFDLPVERHDKLFHLRDTAAASLTLNRIQANVGGRHLFEGLSYTVEPRSILAVTGPSGAGKSILVDLISGLRPPSAGHLELDGIDLRELRPDSLREHVAVARGIEIFEGSLESNVHLNRPQINASDVREALMIVGLVEELMRFPDGVNTELQTGGTPLTTGQAQRLMIARAIVGRPRLLVLDGTLDGLHDDDLQVILDGICGPEHPWTVIITTGRREVAQRCQRILDLTPKRNEPSFQRGDLH